MATAPKAAIESRIQRLAAQLETAEAKATGYRGELTKALREAHAAGITVPQLSKLAGGMSKDRVRKFLTG